MAYALKMVRFIIGILLLTPSFLFGQVNLPEKRASDTFIKVIVFLSVDCPISQKYIPVLNELKTKYEHQVKVIGILPGSPEKKNKRSFTEEYKINFALSTDKKFKWVEALKPTVTPEVFVLDQKNVLKYEGAIDNWFYDLGKYRDRPTEDYLFNAVDLLLSGRDPVLAKTEAIGCPIERPKKYRDD